MVSSWKERLHDWDEPMQDNDSVCEKYIFGEYDNGSVRLPYRLFVPEAAEQKVPLVIFLHGADVTGDDNVIHIAAHDIGTCFAREEMQREHPCFVLAPQYRNGLHWSRDKVHNALRELILNLCSEYPAINKEMICVYGYSAGGIGALRMMKESPKLFHKAIIICGATSNEDLDKLCETPFWLFHAEDDDIVRCGGSESSPYFPAHYGSSEIYDALKDKMGDKIRFTKYEPGELKEKYGVHPHCAWFPVSRDKEALVWLLTDSAVVGDQDD